MGLVPHCNQIPSKTLLVLFGWLVGPSALLYYNTAWFDQMYITSVSHILCAIVCAIVNPVRLLSKAAQEGPTDLLNSSQIFVIVK